MRRVVFLAVVLVGMSFAVSGFTGYTGPEDGPHALDSGGSASASQSVSQNGTEWRMEFSQTGLGSENRSTGVFNGSYGNNSVSFSGVVQVPTPCHQLSSEVVEGEESYVLNVSTKSSGDGLCTQVISYVGYNASFEADEPMRLEVVHDGETVETLTHPDYQVEPVETPPRETGFFQGVVRFFRGLFGNPDGTASQENR